MDDDDRAGARNSVPFCIAGNVLHGGLSKLFSVALFETLNVPKTQDSKMWNETRYMCGAIMLASPRKYVRVAQPNQSCIPALHRELRLLPHENSEIEFPAVLIAHWSECDALSTSNTNWAFAQKTRQSGHCGTVWFPQSLYGTVWFPNFGRFTRRTLQTEAPNGNQSPHAQ